MKRVLVLCTGNSCRSIMAEALINALGAGHYEAVSAGSNPAGYVHPKSIETLKRHGIDPGNPRSKSWNEFAGQHFDLVITVCDAAAAESCPAFLGKYEKLHWSTPDPAKATGTEEEINAAFDEVFGMLRERVEKELLAIQFSINSCFKTFDQSFNRVKYFSCIVDNLDFSSFPTEWGIKQENGVTYAVKEPEGDNEKQCLLDGLRHFMQCYLVRDCIESFAVVLDKLFLLFLIEGKKIHAQQTLYDVLSEDERSLLKKFENAGLSSQDGKIQLLHNHFGLELLSDQKAIVTSLKELRNCFAHGNGFVRRTDGKKDGAENRKFCWKTISIFAVGAESGERYPIEFNKLFPEAGNICMQIMDHSKSFRIGQQMRFSSLETYEIAQSLQFIALRYIEEINRIKSKA